MTELSTILSQPITQIATLITVFGLLQKYGIDVAGFFKWLFQSKDGQDNSDVQDTLQSLFKEMESLRMYANHNTTELLEQIRDTLKDGFSSINTKHAEWDKYGINTRDCDKK